MNSIAEKSLFHKYLSNPEIKPVKHSFDVITINFAEVQAGGFVRIINKTATILVLKSARETTSDIFNFPTSHN